MNILQNRIDSFQNNVVKWPYSNNFKYAKTESFAKAGFYFIRRPKAPDSVRCFICDIELSHWKPNQSPFVRHGHESPYCAWKRLNFPDAHKRPLSDPRKVCDRPRSIIMRSARLATFNCHNYWPPKKGAAKYPTAAKIAGAGFFFNPTATLPSQVKCAYCGESITVYPNDSDLLNKHQELSNGCAFFEKTHSTRNSTSSGSSSTKSNPRSVKGDESDTDSPTSKRPINKALSSSETSQPVAKRSKEQHKVLEPVVIIEKKISDANSDVSSKTKSATPKADGSIWDFNQLLTPPKPSKPKRGVMVTYGSSRPARHHPLSTRRNPSGVNILPDFKSSLIIKPNGPYIVSPASQPTDNVKKTPQASARPKVTRTRRFQKPEASGPSAAAKQETNPSQKRNLSTSSVSNNDIPPTKKVDLKKPIDTETTPSPKKAFRDKGKGRAVEYNLSPSLPTKKAISLSRSRNKLFEPFIYISAAEGSGTSHQAPIEPSPVRANTVYDTQALYGSNIAHDIQDVFPMELDAQDVSPHTAQDTQDVSPHTAQDTQDVSPHTAQDTQDVSPHTAQDTQDVSPHTAQDAQDVSPHTAQDTQDVSNLPTDQDTHDVSFPPMYQDNQDVYSSPGIQYTQDTYPLLNPPSPVYTHEQDTHDVSSLPMYQDNQDVYSSPGTQYTQDTYSLLNPPSPVYTHEQDTQDASSHIAQDNTDVSNLPTDQDTHDVSPYPMNHVNHDVSSPYMYQDNQDVYSPPGTQYTKDTYPLANPSSPVYTHEPSPHYRHEEPFVYQDNVPSPEPIRYSPVREYSSVYNNQPNEHIILPPIREYSSVYNNNQQNQENLLSPVNLPQDSSMHITSYSPECSSSPPHRPTSSAITDMSFLQSTPSDTQRRLASAVDVFGTNPLSPIRISHATPSADLQYTPALTEGRTNQIITNDDEGTAHIAHIKEEPIATELLSEYLSKERDITLEEFVELKIQANIELLQKQCRENIRKVEKMYHFALIQLVKSM